MLKKLANALNSDNDKSLHERLSDREFEVFRLLAAGMQVSEIASKLSLSVTTVSTYRSRVLEKLGMKSNADLTRYAIDAGII
ncbi:MAG: LuxR C-terminal-related transcriptional regulator [Chitinophagaceae bacterium]